MFRDARSRELYSSLCFHDTRKKESGDRTVSYKINLWAVVEVAVRFFKSS